MPIAQKLWTEENKSTIKWVSAGVAVFGLFYIGKVIYNASTKSQTPKKLSPKLDKSSFQRVNTKVTEYSQYYFDKDLEIQFIEASISENPTVQQIYLNSPLIARDQFIKYTQQIRKRRRLIRKSNQDQYINLILTYESEIKQLLFRSRAQLLQSLNIDPEVFEQMQQNYDTIQDLRAINRKSEQLLRSKLKTDTKYKKMSNEILTKIIQQQLCFMHNKMYDRLRHKLQMETITDQHQILLVVEALLQDIIYEKFGYEAEDVERKIEEVGYNTKQIDEARMLMEKDIGGFKFDSLQSEQDQSQAYQTINIKNTVHTLNRSGQDTKLK